MIRKDEVYKIGILNKPHGVKGEVSFTFTDDVFDRVDCDYLICLMDGILVPFYLEEYRFRSDNFWYRPMRNSSASLTTNNAGCC